MQARLVPLSSRTAAWRSCPRASSSASAPCSSSVAPAATAHGGPQHTAPLVESPTPFSRGTPRRFFSFIREARELRGRACVGTGMSPQSHRASPSPVSAASTDAAASASSSVPRARPLHTSPSQSAPSASAAVAALRDDDSDDEGDVGGVDGYDDADVRRFADSSLESLLSEEAGHFGGFPGWVGGLSGGCSAAASPHPDSIAAMMKLAEAEEATSSPGELEAAASGAPEASPVPDHPSPARKADMSDLLHAFDPQSPPPPGSSLQDVQLWLECEAQRESVLRYQRAIASARSRKDHASLTVVQKQLLRWYPALRDRIEREQKEYLRGLKGKTRVKRRDGKAPLEGASKKARRAQERREGMSKYGPFLCALQPEKLAVIVSHEATARSLLQGGGVQLVRLSLAVGRAVEAEVNVQRVLMQRRAARGNGGGDGGRDADADADTAGSEAAGEGGVADADDNGGDGDSDSDNDGVPEVASDWMYGPSHLQAFVDELSDGASNSAAKVRIALANRRALNLLQDHREWTTDDKVKLGTALLEMLLEVATVPAPGGSWQGREGEEMAFRHELKQIPKRDFVVGHIVIDERFYRMATQDEFWSVEGHTEHHRPMVVPPRDWVGPRDGAYAALQVDVMRASSREQTEALRGADLGTVYAGLNALGRVPWVINRRILDAAKRCWDENVPLGDIPSQTDFEVPEEPERPVRPEGELSAEEDNRYRAECSTYYRARAKHWRFRQKNNDLRSLRCSTLLKLNQADKFKEFEQIYFPYNMDFRGRVYPVPPHLSNVGSDLCRGMLQFAKAKPLGPRGLFWLKVHLANLAGADKMPFDGRAKFTDDNMENVRDAVNDPFGPNRWWMGLDDPFQGLATCYEICAAIDSGDPASFECALPVHMDGSCNGLQHYAALGRDQGGGRAVNLCVADEPQDVYVGVMKEVIRRVEEEAAKDPPKFSGVDPQDYTKEQRVAISSNAAARMVSGLIDRSVVKRTVMTSVYGVTFIGAKNQIKEKIEEKLEERGDDIDEMEREIFSACTFLAKLTMDVMGDLFVGARSTMHWLTTCARIVASQGQPVAWMTPIGVPALQPYRQKKPYMVATLLQQVVLTNNTSNLPINRQRQVSAFPPNYVHALDSSHMVLTALEMERRGLTFSAVHDSFWTHACDVDEMNDILRECFIDLHSRPLLEEVKQSWELRCPGLDFPDIPATGDLDLNEVKDAKYFFH